MKSASLSRLVVAAAILAPAGPLFAQQPVTPSTVFRAALATGTIHVDGSLDEPAWGGAEPFPLAYEWFPGDNVAPLVRTECRIVYDASNIYVGCTADDPDPTRIRATYTDRDRAFSDDHMIFVFDPFNDRRRAFQFRVNPLGVQMDALFAADFEDFSWDAIWASAGRITERGYVVEVAIPFKSLRFPDGAAEQSWGFIAERSYPRSVRHRIRSTPTDRDNSCVLCQAGTLAGLQGISPGRDLELSPTLTASRTDTRPGSPAGVIARGDADVEPGLNARWGVTPNVSLNAMLNPDFSQVEADAAQLEVNTRFAPFFPEKRPFFMEGADLFKTMAPVVFTRTVFDPIGGVKASGKHGKNAFGVFAARDRVTNLLFPANQGSRSTGLEQEATSAVARYRRDIGNSSTLGVLYTGRMGDGYANHVGSVDGSLRLSQTNTLDFQYIRSETEYPDSVAAAFGQTSDGFGGGGLIAQLSHGSRNWNAFAQYQSVDRGLRGDAGFLTRVDVEVYRARAERAFWGRPGGWFTRLGFALLGQRLEDRAGMLTDQGMTATVTYLGPKQSSLTLNAGRRQELHRETIHDLTDAGFVFEVRPNGHVTAGVRGDFGDQVDYANGRKGDLLRLAPSVDVRLGRHLSATLDHTFERLSTPAGARIFDANLAQGRLVYNFNARAFARAVLQYRDIRRDPGLYAFPVEAEDRRLTSQFLFSYKVNPQTVLFLGYADTQLGGSTYEMVQSDRTFFLKLGYAWRL